MKIFVESYNQIMQSNAGGVPMRIHKLLQFSESYIDMKLFDKWNDKISDCDILHVFKASVDDCLLIHYAKMHDRQVVVSSVVEQDKKYHIMLSYMLKKIFKINSTYTFIGQSLKLADAIVAQTKKEKEFIARNYKINPVKIHVIPNGVNEALLSLNINKNTDKNIVLNVGRFNANKNQLCLIEAMKFTEVPVYFIGSSVIEEKDYYDKCVESAKGFNNIHFMGWLNQEDPEFLYLYEHAKVVTLLSDYEIFGNSLMEGAAVCANLVTSNALPLNEWGLNNYATCVDPHDTEQLKKSIMAAYESEIDLSLKLLIQNQFSWESVIQKHVNLYKDLLKENTQ